ncbi:hypothetical protein JVU11DRAFT_7285 [Chiua virens]|nr:hypothetical protein JVU11DRAFT_7285 [Chiua virens]
MKTLSSTTVLGKRKKSHLVLRLSSSPAPSEAIETPSTTETTLQVTISVSKKSRYPCAYPDCTKSYSKPSRLAEHERSHTGEVRITMTTEFLLLSYSSFTQRPLTCNSCGKSYLRESHLQAHSRSHLPETEKPYVCTESAECKKRFWTTQHLARHENSHRGDKSYICPKADCDEVFNKHHQLRTHICEVHTPPGTKPYICSYPGCTKSCTTNQKLRGHLKTHDDKRYTCSYPHCLPGDDKDPIYFGTWTALQAHIRKDHPPTCTHPKCKGRTFASQYNLRAHQKLHEQQEIEAQLYHADMTDAPEDASDTENSHPWKRRRGGELGRDWKCDFAGCDKDFKSKNALTTHHNVIHFGQRNHVCPHLHCNSAFGYKHLLERHLAKLHSSTSVHAETTSEDETSTTDAEDHMTIEAITGKAYAARSQNAMSICCPYPHIDALVASNAALDASGPSSSKTCEHVLTRAYDLRRHLRSEHGVDTEKEKVNAWVKARRHVQAS